MEAILLTKRMVVVAEIVFFEALEAEKRTKIHAEEPEIRMYTPLMTSK